MEFFVFFSSIRTEIFRPEGSNFLKSKDLMNSSRIFITGVAGFLGSHLAKWALSQNHKVIGCDNLSLGNKSNIPKGVDFHEYDLLDLEKNRKYTSGVDVVFHAAAWPYDNFSLFSPFKVAENTFAVTASILSASIFNNVPRFIYCSSMSRYGNNKSPFTEDMEPRPLTPYGVAKTAGENLVKSLAQVHDFEYVICIPHNIFGPHQVYNDPYRNAVSLIVNQMLQDQSPVIYGDGEQKRGFSPVQDLIPLFHEILFGEKAKNQVINIGPDEETISLNELIQFLNQITGKNLKANYKPFRPLEIKNALCSSNKARQLLNYKKVSSLKKALEELVKWIDSQGPTKFSYNQMAEIPTASAPLIQQKKSLY